MFNSFNPAITASDAVDWVRNYFKQNGNESTKAVVGISGGIDSATVAAICVAALGADRVIGVHLPQGKQKDLNDAIAVVKHLGIKSISVNIGAATNALYAELEGCFGFNEVVLFNTPARIRMAALYMIAGQVGGRVANTCNYSETYVGYDTKWGDNVGDFAPIAKLTKTEVRLVAYALGLPEQMINKIPQDGMCGQSDEERWGFTYETLDGFLRGDSSVVTITEAVKIVRMHKAAQHKINTLTLPTFWDNRVFNTIQFID